MSSFIRAQFADLAVWAGLCVLAIAGLSSLAALQADQSTDASTPALRVSFRARGLQPGEVVLLTVRASQPLVEVEGAAMGRSIGFWSAEDPKEWQGLVGIPLNTKPGDYDLTVTGSTGIASSSDRTLLTVQGKEFATRQLTLDARFVNPPNDEIDRILEDVKILADTFARTRPERLWSGPFALPVPGTSTSSFGRLTITNGQPGSRHQGTDFRAAEGTPVRAPNAGEVVVVRDLYYAGNAVIIDHGWGLYSLFAHLSKTSVTSGTSVAQGDLLGEAGATGRVTGPHLHWAVRLGNTSVDSLSLVAAVGEDN